MKIDIDKSKYPIRLLQTIEELIRKSKGIKQEYSELVDIENEKSLKERLLVNRMSLDYHDEFQIVFTPNDKLLPFYFSISKPSISTGAPYFQLQIFPASETELSSIKSVVPYADIYTGHFVSWISKINKYGNIVFTDEDLFEKKYTEEFYEEFDLVDEDADVNPFSHDQQIFVYKLLEYLENKLQTSQEKDNPLVQEVIVDISTLQNSIQNQTKKQVVQKLSKIFAKIKKVGIKLIGEVYDTAKKELIKKVINGGFDGISTLIQQIHHH